MFYYYFQYFLLLVAGIIFVEATTEIVVKSKVFEPIRNLVSIPAEKNKYFKYFTTPLFCPHCFSVYASVLFAIVFFRGEKIHTLFLLSLIIHRLSNYLHMVVDRVDKFYLRKE